MVQLQQQLTNVLPNYVEGTESQLIDLKTTQQWLKAMIWQLAISHGFISSMASDNTLTFRYPIDISRELVEMTSEFSQQAMEVHGVGLVEKLFDVACTLIDVMSCVPLSPSSYEMGPREYLNRFLALISSLRSGQSRYLPTLQNKVSEVLPSYQLPLQPRLDMYANPPEPHAPGPGEPSAYPHPSSSSLRHAHDMTPRYPTQEISSIPSQLASPTNYPPFTSTMQYQDPTTSAGMGPSGPYQTHLPSRPGYPS